MNRTKKPAPNHPWRCNHGTTKQHRENDRRRDTIIPLHAKPVK